MEPWHSAFLARQRRRRGGRFRVNRFIIAVAMRKLVSSISLGGSVMRTEQNCRGTLCGTGKKVP
jgi:hypothetical protein